MSLIKRIFLNYHEHTNQFQYYYELYENYNSCCIWVIHAMIFVTLQRHDFKCQFSSIDLLSLHTLNSNETPHYFPKPCHFSFSICSMARYWSFISSYSFENKVKKNFLHDSVCNKISFRQLFKSSFNPRFSFFVHVKSMWIVVSTLNLYNRKIMRYNTPLEFKVALVGM